MTNTVKIQGSGYLLNGIMHVPKADGNSEYELIKQWLAEGNEPEAEFTDEELAKQNKVNTITKLQAKLYLLDSGYYDQVMALVEDNVRLKIYWTDAVNFNKDDVILKGVQVAIGLTDEQLDTMFLEASKL